MIRNVYRSVAHALAIWLIASASAAQPISRESLAHAEMLRAQPWQGATPWPLSPR